MDIVVIHNTMRTIHREYQVMFYSTSMDLPFQASLRIFVFQEKILRPDRCTPNICLLINNSSHIINRNLAVVNHPSIGHIIHSCIEEPAQVVIYLLLMIQGRLPAIPVTVHGIGIIIALAGIGSFGQPASIAENGNASFRASQAFIHIACIEIGFAFFCFVRHIYRDIVLLSSGSGNRHPAFIMHAIYTDTPRSITSQFSTADIKLSPPVTIATVRQGHTIEICFTGPFGVEIYRPRLPTIHSSCTIGLRRTGERRCGSYQYICAINGVCNWPNAHDVETRNIIQIHGRSIGEHATHGKICLNQRSPGANGGYIGEHLSDLSCRSSHHFDGFR